MFVCVLVGVVGACGGMSVAYGGAIHNSGEIDCSYFLLFSPVGVDRADVCVYWQLYRLSL